MVLSAGISNWVNRLPFETLCPSPLAYESNLRRVEEIMLKVIKELYEEPKLVGDINEAKRIHEEVTLTEGGIKSEPNVLLEPVDGEWISAKLVYLVPLNIKYEVKATLTRRILEAFNAEPERVKFPVGRSR
jgi:small-conductance mechanosensitive channel